MIREEAVNKLKDIASGSFYTTPYDQENQHVDADAVLIEFLNSIGYTDVVEAWDDVPKWYA